MVAVDALHHQAPEGLRSHGLQVAFTEGEIVVAPGWWELPADHPWVRQQNPPIGNRWEIPVEVRLPLPAADEPGMPWPYLTLAFNVETGKAGVYLSHNGEFPDHIRTIEFLAWRRPEDGGRWSIRHLHEFDRGRDPDWHAGIGRAPKRAALFQTHGGRA